MARHPLDGAFRRVDRAREHTAHLKRRADAVRQEQEDALTFKVHPTMPDQMQAFISRNVPPHFMLGILTGEICYNLRAALDYLIFELAYIDSGQFQEATQFPIDDMKDVFARNVARKLRGLNPKHVAQVEALQPYNGCNWTRALRDISNPDKHRTLVSLQGDHLLDLLAVDAEHLHMLESMPGTVRRTHKPTGEEVYVKFRLTTSVQFRDGTPVIETLEVIETQVAQTLEAFKTEFK